MAAHPTKNGVCYNLAVSPWTFEYRDMSFAFSSRAHRDRFADSVTSRCHWLNDSLARRFKVTCEIEELALVQLYLMIETRGFYMVIDGKVMTCPDSLVFRGRLDSGSGSGMPSRRTTERLIG